MRRGGRRSLCDASQLDYWKSGFFEQIGDRCEYGLYGETIYGEILYGETLNINEKRTGTPRCPARIRSTSPEGKRCRCCLAFFQLACVGIIVEVIGVVDDLLCDLLVMAAGIRGIYPIDCLDSHRLYSLCLIIVFDEEDSALTT